MPEADWIDRSIGDCLDASFAGEWGTEPNPANATVLRATDIDDAGHVVGAGAARSIPKSKLRAKQLKDGDTLLEGSGGGPGKPVGRVALFEADAHIGPAICSNFFKTLRPNRSVVDERFLWRKLCWFYGQPALLALQQQTTGIINLKFAEYLGARCTVPAELPEQTKIAEILDTLDTTIRQTEVIIEKLKQVKQGLLHDLLTRGIDANGELRPPQSQAPHFYRNSPLGWIPSEWGISRVGDEADIRHGFAFPGHLFTSEPKGYRLLVPGNFSRFGGLDFSEANTKYFGGQHSTKSVLEDGEALIVMTDLSPMTLILGRAVLLNEGFPVLHNQRIGKFVFRHPTDWHPQFFVMLMNDDRLRRRVIAEATGTTVRHTSPDRIKAGLVAKPSIEEQAEIAHRLAAVSMRISAEADLASKLRHSKSGLMDDLLTGRTRVTPLLDAAAHA